MDDLRPIGRDFFARDVHSVARGLIGCLLTYEGSGGIIVETESYNAEDPACHAYNGRTARNAPLFEAPGIAYVYLSYGIHNLLNFVAEPEGQAAAVLIRALEPTHGIERMRLRRGGREIHELCSGPGRLTEAMGVSLADNWRAIDEAPFELFHRSNTEVEVSTGPRIGISQATDFPWRFCAVGSRFVSRTRPKQAV